MDTDVIAASAGDPLRGLRILVTRAVGQAEPLCRMIEAAGGEPLRCPALEIQDIGPDAALDALVDRLDSYDMAVFISPNAVERGLGRVRSRRVWPRDLRIAAVGHVTARTLKQQGLHADIYPPGKSNSEALLALDTLCEAVGLRIVIFRGRGGRELLRDTLVARGATVDYAEVYQRIRPAGSLESVSRKPPDLLTAHSQAALENLLEMAGAGADRLRDIPLVLASERLVGPVYALGFNRLPVVAAAPGDEALFAAIIDWATGRRSAAQPGK